MVEGKYCKRSKDNCASWNNRNGVSGHAGQSGPYRDTVLSMDLYVSPWHFYLACTGCYEG